MRTTKDNSKKNRLMVLAALFALHSSPFISEAVAQKLSVANPEQDCGKTGFNIPATVSFEMENTGRRQLNIISVTPDCGCTKVEYPRKGIAAGEKFTIKMTYDARQLGHFYKQAAVKSNGTKEPIYITMKGVVLPEVQDYSGNYPFRMGAMLIDRDAIEFDDVNQGDQPQQVIHIMNDGVDEIQPSVMHLPSYLTAEVAPERLAPGHAGTITLTLDTKAIRTLGLTQTNVYLAQHLGETVRSDNELNVSVVVLPDLKSLAGGQKAFSPQLQLSTTDLNLGSFDGKSKKSGEIVITNNGRTALTISALQMFTPGLRVTLDDREIRPGASTKLKVVAYREELARVRTQPRVLMITNDPDHSKVVINITYTP